jgi:hypothetical protein
MDDRQRAQELLAQAWRHQPANGLDRIAILVSALVHAILAGESTPAELVDAETAARRRRELELASWGATRS